MQLFKSVATSYPEVRIAARRVFSRGGTVQVSSAIATVIIIIVILIIIIIVILIIIIIVSSLNAKMFLAQLFSRCQKGFPPRDVNLKPK